MFTATVRFKLPPHIDYAACRAHFHNMAPAFREVRGLLSKHLICGDGGWAGGIYQWERVEDAKEFYTGPWLDGFVRRYGTKPQIEIYEVFAVADNAGGKVELSQSIPRDALTAGLSESDLHNYSKAFRRLERQIFPGDIKRAIGYIEAHLDAPVTIPEIVAASRVPGRTLFKHFKHYHGLSPMAYVRMARYQKVRERLERAGPDEQVSEIAIGLGFEHLGRFAVEYRKRFGESPSETLRSTAKQVF
jgi:AraC-like DNA-binding protein